MTETKPKTKMVMAKSFLVYISKQIRKDFKIEDLEIGFTEITSSTLGGKIYYERPPERKMVKGVIKKRDLSFLEDFPYKENLPELLYFV